MLPFGIGFSEVLLILVVVLLVVGPQKLPEIARTLGKGVRAARRAGQELRDAVELDEIRRSVYDHTVRPWQQATDIEDAEVERGTLGRAAAAATAARTAADAPDPHLGDPEAPDPDAHTYDPDAHDPDEAAPSGPIARGPGPIVQGPNPERPDRAAEPIPEPSTGSADPERQA